MEYVPSSIKVEITAKAQVSAAKLGLTGEQLSEVVNTAHRINRYKDGLRLWHIRAGERAGWVAVHEVLSLAGTGALAKATAIDVLTEDEVEGDGRWRERVVVQARPRHKSGPHYLARSR
jgi:hypothetical protein